MTKEISKEVDRKVSKNIFSIDIDKLVKKAQEGYEKKENGLAKQLSTGITLTKSEADEDYVVWNYGDYWKKLTHLKGLPMGRIVQISGKPDSGKSTAAMCFMKCAQDQDILVILWDAERKFSKNRFDVKMGGQSDKLLVVNTNKIIDGAKAVAQFVHAAKEMYPNVKILIVWDSVGSSLNSTEDRDEGEDYSQQPGVSAKEISYAIKKFNKLSNKYMDKETGEETIATLVINQTYASIGIGPSVQIEKGGSELYYLSSIIIQMTRKKDLTRVKGGDKFKYGILSRAKVKKNHLFDGDECISELDVAVSAEGIQLADDIKSFEDIKGWDDKEDD